MLNRILLVAAAFTLTAFAPWTGGIDPELPCSPYADQGCVCDTNGNPLPTVLSASVANGPGTPGWCDPDKPCSGSFELIITNNNAGFMVVYDPVTGQRKVIPGGGGQFKHTVMVSNWCGKFDQIEIQFAFRNPQGGFTQGSATFTYGCTDWNFIEV